MTEKILQLLEEKRALLPSGELLADGSQFRIAKMCQRIVGDDTKVLFLVSCGGSPICIVKIMRDVSHNEKLRNEKAAQEKLIQSGTESVPHVYFDGMINGYYVYGEEIAEGEFISRSLARKKERDIIDIIRSFPVYGAISTQEIGKIFLEHAPREDKDFILLIDELLRSNVILKKGLTHSDFGRPNIILSRNGIKIIDWERAGDRPFWLIDAVYFMIKTRKIGSLEEWREKAMSVFIKYTGVSEASALALYRVLKIYDIFQKKHPESYKKVVTLIKVL